MVSLSPKRRYWLSMAGIVLGTLLVAGLAGGAVALRLGPGSLVSGTVVVGILLVGWMLGSRVTERKKLDLPLWRALTADQDRELARFREFKRTGRVLEPEDGTADGSADGARAADPSSLFRKDRAAPAAPIRAGERSGHPPAPLPRPAPGSRPAPHPTPFPARSPTSAVAP
mgnify:CR=1 FL=1